MPGKLQYLNQALIKSKGMTNVTQFPEFFARVNFDKHLSDLALVCKVSYFLTGNRDFTSLCLKSAIKGDVPTKQIILTLRDMATDNYNAIVKLVGEETASEILNHRS